ncbi:MAG: PD-(D/E)XK nuclease family protein, partial [Clostridia bacterium]|nr:PD-(D/E)XK nuclease family protein [Clostridia bacterium]
FERLKFPPYDGYITKAEGARSFSRDCNRFASLKIDDFSVQSGFYAATNGEPERIVNYANKEVKIKLDGKKGALLRGVTSPTTIEDYYACPYRSFLIHTLKVKERETGKVNALSVGNLMHEIFNGFIGRVEEATDKDKTDALFDEIAAEVLKKDEYARFDDAESSFGVRLALKECNKYCYDMSRFYSVTAFKTDKTHLERSFGYYDKDGNSYPAVDLLGGRVKLAGKIDRVDEYKDYFRITDYKTGGSEVGDDKIFAGVKLQLYLYSLAVTDKTLAGAYYLRVNDEYKAADGKVKPLFEGKTALDVDALNESEGEFIPTDGKNKAVKAETLIQVQKYVKALAEQAAEQLSDGVIVPSPYAGTCAYCDFAAMCSKALAERKVSGVDTEFIAESVKGAGEDLNGGK